MQKAYKEKKILRQIVEETKQIALVIDSATESDLQCEFCAESSKMVSPLLAAKILQISTREIYKLIEAEKTHFIEFQDKRMFVCLPSLKREINRRVE